LEIGSLCNITPTVTSGRVGDLDINEVVVRWQVGQINVGCGRSGEMMVANRTCDIVCRGFLIGEDVVKRLA
jgi:hypothetical protein